MAELLERLQAAVGAAYRIEAELGGGGMSRVFLAEDVELGRRVVIKVLPPEMAAGVNQERFRREIQLAARLQHPHIVPLLSAGSADDLLYYMMPFIEGESLRVKLGREGELPVSQAVRILREVVDALAYAHRHGVVHRDIKPDNVLLSEDHAVVTDFGVAKAVSESTGQSSLTSMGVALGTPAYMAPEQAVADPHVDHRADIYAVGALAYEMLCGRPPFVGVNPQAVLSAQVTEAPEPATKHRAAVPPVLNTLIMRCLAKKAADRSQRAEELLGQLDAVLTPSGGITPTDTQPVTAADYETRARRAHPVRVAALFGVGSVAALGLVYATILALGLPDWVFLGAVALLAVGLPIMVTTGHIERKRALEQTADSSVAADGREQHIVHRLFTWRNSLLGGGVAFAGLGLVVTAYMAMRVLGIGPVGTLVAAGVLAEQERLVLADFENRTDDPTLGESVTELLRIDLAQSPTVTVLEPSQVASVLARMRRDPSAPLTFQLANEVAQREGLKAVVAGEILPVGSGYVVSARIALVRSGDILVAARETATGPDEIIGAVDRLSASLRERIGESLKSIRRNDPLHRVTTASLEALRRYSQAVRAHEVEGDFDKAVSLLEEAVSYDTAFAMAYRKLGAVLIGGQQESARWVAALTRAFEHRDRLTEPERYLTMGTYYWYVRRDRDQAINAYRALLQTYPDDFRALHNLALIYSEARNWPEAEELELQGLRVAPENLLAYWTAMSDQVAQGKLTAAESTLALMGERFPGNPRVDEVTALLQSARGKHAEAEERVAALRESQRGNLTWQSATSDLLANLALVRGGLAEAERHWRDRMRTEEERDLRGEYLEAAVLLASLDVAFRDDPSRGWAQIESVLQRHPLDSIPPSDRPYRWLAYVAARADRPAVARRYLREYGLAVDVELPGSLAGPSPAQVSGVVSLAEGDPRQAVSQLRVADEETGCVLCVLPDLARAYDRAGQADSAIAVYQRYLASPSLFRVYFDSYDMGPTYKRLGELYEDQGDHLKAVEYYNRLVELWKDADPELQPLVEDVRGRIARLVGERR